MWLDEMLPSVEVHIQETWSPGYHHDTRVQSLSSHGEQSKAVSTMKPLLMIRPGPLSNSGDYLPPESSRAGQFARLERAGRRAEALKREKRRASQGGISPRAMGVIQLTNDGSPIPKSMNARSPNLVHEEDVELDAKLGNPNGVQDDAQHVHGEDGLPGQFAWGTQEDELLRSNDPEAYQALASRVGSRMVKTRLMAYYAGVN
jgi:hypothetical protein